METPENTVETVEVTFNISNKTRRYLVRKAKKNNMSPEAYLQKIVSEIQADETKHRTYFIRNTDKKYVFDLIKVTRLDFLSVLFHDLYHGTVRIVK